MLRSINVLFASLMAALLAQPLPDVRGTASPQATLSAPPLDRSPAATGATTSAATPAPPADAAVIRNSGSTNTVGYTIVLSPDGRAVIGQNSRRAEATVGRPQTRWLFAKLHEAGPLTALPIGHCMHSASFGSVTTVTYAGATTPDLSCAVSPLERELARTIGVIVAQLHVSTFPVQRRYPLQRADGAVEPHLRR